MLQTNPIMENFGNARTVWNNNSSRFGKFLTLQFSATGRMQGAFMRTYLLEKSRITSQLPDEQNYHVLYMVANGLPADLRKQYHLDAWHTYDYLNAKANPGRVDWKEFPTDFAELAQAMDAIPTVAPHAHGVWKIIAAILHLGNAKFAGADEDDAQFAGGEGNASIVHAASLLGCEAKQLVRPSAR